MPGSPTVDRMTVGDAMHTGIVACDVHAPLSAVARMMAAHRIHCVVVRNSAVEWTDPGAGLWGVISDLDLVRLVATAPSRPDGGPERRNSGIRRRGARIRAGGGPAHGGQRRTHLVVVNHAARPVGVLSTLDVAQAVSDAVHVPR